MDKYQQAIFDFATKDENFEFTFEIGNNFELFRRKLINDFWDNVVFLLKEKSIELNGWIPWKENEVVTGGDTIAGIYSNEYYSENYDTSANISFFNWGDGRVLYGIFFNQKVPGINYDKILEFAQKTIKSDWQIAPKSWWWPVYKYTGENFKTFLSLQKILPNQREALAEEFVNNLINAKSELSFLIVKFGVKI